MKPRKFGRPRPPSPRDPRNSSNDPLKSKRYRKAIGLHAAREVFNVRPKEIHSLLLRKSYEDSEALRELAALAKKFKVRIEEREVGHLNQLSEGHQGVCVLIEGAPEVNWTQLENLPNSLVLVLDRIEDPHNLGAILRTAWLMNVQAVFCDEDRAASLSPTVHKVASGGVEHVPVDFSSDLVASLNRLKEMGYWLFGLQDSARQGLWGMKFPEKVALVIGSEGQGLRGGTAKVCEDFLSIPQAVKSASYNASVAAAIVISEVQRQKNPTSGRG